MVPVIRVPPLPKGRTYGDEPLPLKPSEHAPRKATIKQRVALPDRVAYTLDIGGIDVEDVGIDEVLDYVSAFDLEQYENRQFEEEREIMRIARLERDAERERRKQRAKTKGRVIYRSDSDTETDEDEEVETGKHGRARPTYKHLFKVPEMRQRRRRRKRDPITGELMPLSDDEDAGSTAPSSEPPKAESTRSPAPPAAELPKRRRRKRDPLTGELLSLSPTREPAQPTPQLSSETKKRPRRRRHPVTGELMPLGWRYHPDEEQQSHEQRRDGNGGAKVPSMNRLSIAREHDAKRVKLTSEEPSSDDELMANQPATKSAMKIEISQSDDLRNSSSQEPPVSTSKSKQTPKNSMFQRISQDNPRPRPSSSVADSSSGPGMTLASFLQSSKQNEGADSSSDESSSVAEQKVQTPADRGKTSIMYPMAVQTEDESDRAEGENEDLDEGEWFVEAILGHHLSDPRTHPGKKRTMLYKTKWEGWDEPTWEPLDSFVSLSVVDDYRKRAGLDRSSKTQKTSAAPEPKKKSVTPAAKSKAPPPVIIDESDEDEEDGYEVEAILAHHMSDPRTHPGKPATMLYKVKWLGWSELTWEPRRSFTNKSIVRQYEKRFGLNEEENDDDESDESDIKMEI